MVFLSTFTKGSMCDRLEILKWVPCHRGSENHSSKVVFGTLGGSRPHSERAIPPPACVNSGTGGLLHPSDGANKTAQSPEILAGVLALHLPLQESH